MRIAHPDGRILHAELRAGASVLMMGDVEQPFVSPNAAGGTTMLRDPFGHMWIFLTHLHDMSIDDVVARGEAALQHAGEHG
ncbi:VOC family protein [Actinoplanes sp. NPDC000266]